MAIEAGYQSSKEMMACPDGVKNFALNFVPVRRLASAEYTFFFTIPGCEIELSLGL